MEEDTNKWEKHKICRILGDMCYEGEKVKQERLTDSMKRSFSKYSGQSHFKNLFNTIPFGEFLSVL